MNWTKFKPELSHYDLRKAIFAGIIFFLLTGVVAGLIPTPLYERMVPITILDYVFLFTTSLLAGIYFGKEKSCRIQDDSRHAFLGGLTGFLAFACPICNALFLLFFSSSAIMTYFDPLRPYMGLVSTLFLAVIVYRTEECS